MRGRLGLVVILALGILLAPLAGDAQQAEKVHRIGFLATTRTPHIVEAFLQRLRELGYVEGRNIIIEWRFSGGRAEQLPVLTAELVRLKVDLIVATATPAALAAKNATKTIPIVAVAVADPVGVGLVASFARPGGNITALSLLNPEISGKRLELLKEVVPRISRAAFLVNPANPTGVTLLRETQAAAQALRVQLLPLEVRDPNEFEAAVGAATRGKVGALIVVDDPFTFSHRARIVALAAKSRLPVMGGFREFVDAGGLISYGPDLSHLNRRAAVYVDKILKGAKPADLPVEQPTRFELVINLKTGKALGLTIPQSVLIRADEVIQ